MIPKQDKAFTRTATDLERKYDLGKSFSEVREGIKVANAAAQAAKKTAVNAENEARAARSEVLQLSDSITLTVEDGEPGHTAMIKLKVGDKEITGRIDLQGCVTFTNLRTSGSTEINGDNLVTGKVSSTDGHTSINLDTGEAFLYSGLFTNKLMLGDEDKPGIYGYLDVFSFNGIDKVPKLIFKDSNANQLFSLGGEYHSDGTIAGEKLEMRAPDGGSTLGLMVDDDGSHLLMGRGAGMVYILTKDTDGVVSINLNKINGKTARWEYNATIGHYILVSDDE